MAPIPGETKVWQYITLMKSIYLVDCPGTVQPSGNSEEDAVLKGVVRIEQLRHAEEYIEPLLGRVRKEYIQRTYGIAEWEDAHDFLEQHARKIGKLLKGCEPDVNAAAKLMLHDFQVCARRARTGTPPVHVPCASAHVYGVCVARACTTSSAGVCRTLRCRPAWRARTPWGAATGPSARRPRPPSRGRSGPST